MNTRPLTGSRSELVVVIPAGTTTLEGILRLPAQPAGVVIFAHGSGSGRFSPRNRFVADVLQASGLATLLLDLLDEAEAQDRSRVFDIPFLAARLQITADWLETEPAARGLPVGYFGASTGGGAALLAAAGQPDRIGAVVSRGGRPDLAGDALPRVQAPTLLIVGGHDPEVLALNREAFATLVCPKQLVVVPGATHLFPEPGALAEVARLASLWFAQYLHGNSKVNRKVPPSS